jgi:O-antigen/teichoic acid export membrane protein
MTPHMRYGLIGVVIGLILLWLVGPVVGIIVIAAAIAIPVIAYRMLSPSQRRRLRENRRRKQIGG